MEKHVLDVKQVYYILEQHVLDVKQVYDIHGKACFGCKIEKNLSVCFLMSFVIIYLFVQDATNGKC